LLVVCGQDIDCDTVVDGADNCRTVANTDQRNSDGDFIDLSAGGLPYDDLTWPNSDAAGDACDDDDDNDGLTDTDEAAGCGSAPTDATSRDTDRDRFLDGAECSLGSNPNDPQSKPAVAACGTSTADADGDEVLDFRERCYFNTSSAGVNTDGDACDDRREVASVNGDLAVTSIDLQQVAMQYGPYGIGSYRVHFDANRDGTVNSLDLSFVAQAFGACA
jgi:hypothetical protein